ncbi:MAG: YggS family pyridoxal phosphate-dependent enzyme [Thermomicrobiales bacterium]
MTDTQVTSAGIETRIEHVRQRIAEAATVTGRDPTGITIVAVTKSVDRSVVDLAFAAGLRHFGENRVRDALRKFDPPLPPGATLHMIGQLQSNKARHAIELFDFVESVDRSSLVLALEKHAADRGRKLPVLIQVNVAGEDQKAGCHPLDAQRLASMVLHQPHLELRGLMTIAPLVVETETIRPVFRQLRQLRDQLQINLPDGRLSILSMGMSNDYQIAIEEGATHVRIGRAIFG